MGNQFAKKALVEDIKRDVILELNRTHGPHPHERPLIDSIKRDVLLDLGSERAFVQAIKNEVLADIRASVRGYGNAGACGTAGTSPYPDQATINAVKKEVLAQIEAERETWEQPAPGGQTHGQQPDPALIEAVKNSVLAEMNAHHRPSM